MSPRTMCYIHPVFLSVQTSIIKIPLFYGVQSAQLAWWGKEMIFKVPSHLKPFHDSWRWNLLCSQESCDRHRQKWKFKYRSNSTEVPFLNSIFRTVIFRGGMFSSSVAFPLQNNRSIYKHLLPGRCSNFHLMSSALGVHYLKLSPQTKSISVENPMSVLSL